MIMKFEVRIKQIEIYDLEIEADSEQEAIEVAHEKLASEDKHKYHVDSDGEDTAYEI